MATPLLLRHAKCWYAKLGPGWQHLLDCAFLAKGFCSATSIELDPEDGCLTYTEDSNDLISNSLIDEEDTEFEDYEESWEDEGFDEIDFEEDEDY